VLLVALLGAVSGWLVYKQKTLKQHEALVLMEQKALRSQLNPHFIFNALGAIQNFMLQNKPEEAGGYMTRFARLMRQILENSREDYVSLEEEISTLENYLELQLLRFRGRFTYEIVVASDIDREEVSIPPMFAQPFIENALEHGLKDMQSGGKVLVSFTRQHDHILLTVEDNGVGLGGTYVTREGHKSLAGTITAERVSLINKGLKRKIELIVEDLKAMEGGSGTRVKLAMPYRLV
jgi:LytS/YehU family sensor histidine kinase